MAEFLQQCGSWGVLATLAAYDARRQRQLQAAAQSNA